MHSRALAPVAATYLNQGAGQGLILSALLKAAGTPRIILRLALCGTDVRLAACGMRASPRIVLEKIELGWRRCNCRKISARQNVPEFDRLARERRDPSQMNSLLSPRAFGRSIYESPVIAGFRRAHYEQYVERESRRTQSIVQALGFNLLTTDALDVLGAEKIRRCSFLGARTSKPAHRSTF